jgi:hypothetical protein
MSTQEKLTRVPIAPIRGGDLLHLDAFCYQNVLYSLLPSTLKHPHVYVVHLRSNGNCYSVYDSNLVDLLPAVHSASCILESNSISGGEVLVHKDHVLRRCGFSE